MSKHSETLVDKALAGVVGRIEMRHDDGREVVVVSFRRDKLEDAIKALIAMRDERDYLGRSNHHSG